MSFYHPPSFQEYPGNWASSITYRLLSFAQRGLLHQMRCECWGNQYIPSDPKDLACLWGVDPGEVEMLLPGVMPFFAVKDGKIFSPSLEEYRAKLKSAHDRQSAGGKKAQATAKTRLKAVK